MVETASHTSQLSVLISLLNSPSHLQWEATKEDCLHWSDFSGWDGENIEKLNSCWFRRTHVARLTWLCFPVSPARCGTVSASHSTFHFWQVNCLACASAAFVLHVLAITFRQSATTTTPPPLYGLFSETTRVSWCQKKASSGLYGARTMEDNKRQTIRDGRHSIRTNQQSTFINPPIFTLDALPAATLPTDVTQ